MSLNLDINFVNGALNLLDSATGAVVLPGGGVVVEFGDGSSLLTNTWAPGEIDATRMPGRVLWPGGAERPEVELEWRAERNGSLGLLAYLHNVTTVDLTLESISLVFDRIELGVSSDELAFYRVGWQSWSPTGTVLISNDTLPAAPPVVAPIVQSPHDSGLTSSWAALIGVPDASQLLAGFTTAFNQLSTIRVSRESEFWATCHLEGKIIQPGEKIATEMLLFVSGDDENALLQKYAEAIAEAMGALPSKPRPAGWCSWYQYFSGVCQEHILDNLTWLEQHGLQGEIQVVQLDDGYEADFGDWLTVNEKFPRGLGWLTEQIRSAGFTPGIWLAPFAISPESTLFQAHPDWVVTDRDGQPLETWSGFDWDRQLYGLDCTHPGAQNWLRKVFETVVSEWGFDYLKLDFLCCGALRGQRHDSQSTSIQAYRLGLAIIREVVGDRYLLGCGAPLLPAVGLVNGMRIGCDVAPFWQADAADIYNVWPAAQNAVRNTLTRQWMHGYLWDNDPDCLILRDSETQLTDAEVRSWAGLVGLTGGLRVLSDDLSKLSDARVDLLDQILSPHGGSATIHGLLKPELPDTLVLKVDRHTEVWYVIGLFNWGDSVKERAVNLSELFGDGRWHLFDFWAGSYLGTHESIFLFELLAHDSCLLGVRPVQKRPQLVGTTFHITQGGVEVSEMDWTGQSLAVQLQLSRSRSGKLVFAWPEEWYLQDIVGLEDGVRSRATQRDLTIEGHVPNGTRLELHFQYRGTSR